MKQAFFVGLLILYSGITRAQMDNSAVYIGCTDTKMHPNDNISYHVDKCPEFRGGFDKFLSYVVHNIRLQKTKDTLPGRMLIEVIIEKDGSLSNPIIIAGRNKKINKEVLRVFRKSPKWQPGMFRDKPVRCYYEIPLTIDLSQS